MARNFIDMIHQHSHVDDGHVDDRILKTVEETCGSLTSILIIDSSTSLVY